MTTNNRGRGRARADLAAGQREESGQPRRGGRWARYAVAGALLFIAALTLLPAGGHPEPPSTCIICGLRGAADAFLNVLLFMPLGAALAWAGLRAARVIPLGAALSITIEVAQLWIPGRESSIGDVITNTTGTAAGVLLFQLLPPLLLLARRHARALELALPVATVALLGAGAVLLRPAFSPGTYYPAWRPKADHPYFLSGPVTLARLADLPLRRGYIEDGSLVSALWLAGAPLRLVTQPSADTLTEASVFALYDAAGHELLQLGVDGADLVLRFRTAGAMLRLDQPDMRLAGAAAALRSTPGPGAAAGQPVPRGRVGEGESGSIALAAGPRRAAGARARPFGGVAAPFTVARAWSSADAPKADTGRTPAQELGGRPDGRSDGPAPMLLRAWRRGPDYCMEVNGRGSCGLGYGVARSWAVLLYQGGLWPWAALLDALWLLALFLPAGLVLRRGSAPLTLACLAAGLALLPWAAGLLPTAPVAWLGAVAGVAGGAALRRVVQGRRRPAQGVAAGMRASSARTSTAMQRSMRS